MTLLMILDFLQVQDTQRSHLAKDEYFLSSKNLL
jgi:hypothetical protein